jgi:molybdopterin-guanine dinucleotide biosynthesis protein A
MNRVPVYILAGGKSSRLGRDKARVEIDGEPLLVRVARSLEPFARSITVVADRAGKYRDLGFETIADREPGLGPLGGLQTALGHCRDGGWILCASCDRIGIRPGWLRALFSGRKNGAKAVVFRGRIWQPLPALYHASLAPEVDAAVASGRLTPWMLLEHAGVVSLRLPDDWETSVDINDPEELSKLAPKGGPTWPIE